MPRLFDDASTEFMEKDVAPVTAAPFSMLCWVRSDAASTLQGLMFLGDKDTVNDHWYLSLHSNSRARLTASGGGSPNRAQSSTNWTANTWHHITGYEESTTSRAVFVDAGGKGTNTASEVVENSDRISIGRLGDSTPSNYMSGDIADALLLNVVPTDAEVTSIFGGFLPRRIRPKNVKGYWPIHGMNSPETDWSFEGNDLTLSGTVKSTGEAPPQMLHPIFDRSYRNRGRGMRRQISKGVSLGGFEP